MSAAQVIPVEEPFLSVEEYLHTSYRPDRDYVDGRVEDRNVGEWEHAAVQKMLMSIFLTHEESWGVSIIQECRLQIAQHRFRVPDTMVLRADQQVRRILHDAPLICIEVISPQDTWKRLIGVLTDYLTLGVPHIWAFDPDERKAYRFDAQGLHPVFGHITAEGTPVRFEVDEVFRKLPPA